MKKEKWKDQEMAKHYALIKFLVVVYPVQMIENMDMHILFLMTKDPELKVSDIAKVP